MSGSDTFQVLLVEDNPDDVFLMRQAFRKAGSPSRLHAVADGIEALAYLRGEGGFADRAAHPSPDAVLLDLNMPRLNGFEVLQQLRATPAWDSLPVFVFSASNLPADLRRAHALRANAYVVKPNRLDELVAFAAALQQWLSFTVASRHGLPLPPG